MKSIWFIIKEDWRWFVLVTILFVLMGVKGVAQQPDTASVRAEIMKNDILFPDIVLAQAIKETGWFQSYGCLTRNNLFGFYWKKQYKEWDTWQESVKYYADWQKRHYKGGDYFQFLKDRGYASDVFYEKDLQLTYPLKQ